MLLATGHPTGILVIHLAVAAALRAAGAEVLRRDARLVVALGGRQRLGARPAPPRPQRQRRARAGQRRRAAPHPPARADARGARQRCTTPPDLVVADHGWAGVAAQAGLETLAFADCNDPALFVAEDEGLPIITVPLDDNVLPHLYDPLSAHLTRPGASPDGLWCESHPHRYAHAARA